MRQHRSKKPRPPLSEDALERLALFYAGRYATTRAKLRAYLSRKVAEQGWAGAESAPIDALTDRLADLGYVDDAAFASARAASLLRRGYGERRIGDELRAAGLEGEDGAPAREEARLGAWTAALRFAERRRIGPYAPGASDPDTRHKAAAAMLRAGHPADFVRRIVNASPGVIPDSDGS